MIDWSAMKKQSDLVRHLSNLGDQKSRDYELAITDIARQCPDNRLSWFEDVLGDEKESVEVRFSAFFVLVTHYRRFNNFQKFDELVRKYGSLFNGQPMYAHIVGLLHAGLGGRRDLEVAIDLSRSASKSLPSHPGVLHAFASHVAAAEESGIELRDEVRDEAKRALNTAIGLETKPYAKFYCTKGRLLVLRGEWDEAQKAIQEAMRIEDEHETDYALRMSEYQSQLAGVQVRRLELELDKARSSISEIESHIENRFDELRGQSLATLGLFTAILSFTLGSIQIARGHSFDQAAHLIIVMAGSLMAVYGVFAMIVRRQNDQGDWPLVIATLVGVAVVLIALFA